MYTRKQYLDGECTHRQFYAQMVTEAVRNTVLRYIGRERLAASKDVENLNDIPLKLWDALPATAAIGNAVRATGDYLTLAGKVCVYKEAARQIIEAADDADVDESEKDGYGDHNAMEDCDCRDCHELAATGDNLCAACITAGCSPAGNEPCENSAELPPCVLAMRCYCAGHARGNPASEPCDTSE